MPASFLGPFTYSAAQLGVIQDSTIDGATETVRFGVDSSPDLRFQYTVLVTDPVSGSVTVTETFGLDGYYNTYYGRLTGYSSGGAFTIANSFTAGTSEGVTYPRVSSVFEWLFLPSVIAGGTLTLYNDERAGPFVPCYCAGTLIRTERGDVAVEALRIGERVVTASGTLAPVRWIGRRHYFGQFFARHSALRPVRIRAGALGAGLPERDLRVSSLHAVFLDGVLVPAGLLVNGETIVRDDACRRVDYFHIELDRHDLVLAEGAASETFVDDNGRDIFQNAAEWEALYPGRVRVPAVYCARRVESGPELEAIRERLGAGCPEVQRAA